jgi:hypothetical protein
VEITGDLGKASLGEMVDKIIGAGLKENVALYICSVAVLAKTEI